MRTSLIAAAVAALVMLAAAPAAADCSVSTSDSFPLVNSSDMVVDSDHGHVFLTGADISNTQASGSSEPLVPADEVVVRGLDGGPQKVIGGLPGAKGLALDSTRSLLYVALSRAQEIVAISTVTLTQVASYPTGDGVAPMWVAMSGSDVWFTSPRGMGVIDPAVPGSQAVLSDAPCGYGRLRSTPAVPGLLVSVTSYEMCVVRVSGTRVVGSSDAPAPAYDVPFVLTPDGSDIIIADQMYRTSDLQAHGIYGGTDTTKDDLQYPVAAAIDHAGNAVIVRQDVDDGQVDLEIASRGSVLQHIQLTDLLGPLAFDADSATLYYVAVGDGGYTARLGMVRFPLRPAADVSVTGPMTIDQGGTVVLNGTLAGRDGPISGVQLSVARTDSTGTATLSPVRTDAQGGFSLTESPPGTGRTTYCFRYEGGDTYRPSCGTLLVHVRAATQATAEAPPPGSDPRDLSVHGRITSSGVPITDNTYARVTLVTDDGRTRYFSAPIASDGTYSVGPVPPTDHSDPYSGTFTVYYGGDADHQSSSASVQDSARRPAEATTVSLTDTVVGVTGQLVTAEGGLAGQLSVSRHDARGDHQLAPITAGSDGGFAIDDHDASGGANVYTVSFAGAGFYGPSSASLTVQEPKQEPGLTVTTDRTSYQSGSSARVTVGLQGGAANRGVQLYATPVGGKRALLAAGSVNAAGELQTTYQVVVGTTFTAVYDGDDATDAAAVDTAVSSVARLSSAQSGNYARQGSYGVYHLTARPAVSVSVVPVRAGACVRLRVERVVSGRWSLRAVSACGALDSRGRRVTTYSGSSFVAGAHYRLRYEFGGDTAVVAATSGWQYLIVR